MSFMGLIMAGRMVRHGSGEFVTRSEYLITEDARIISFIALLGSMVLGCIGCKTIKAVNKANPDFANLVFRKNIFRVAIIFVMCLVAHHFKKDMYNLKNGGNIRPTHERPTQHFEIPEEMPEFDEPISEESEQEELDDEMEYQNEGRHLQSRSNGGKKWNGKTWGKSKNGKTGGNSRNSGKKTSMKKRVKRVVPTSDQIDERKKAYLAKKASYKKKMNGKKSKMS